MIFNNELSETEIQKIEGYLAHKWGLTSSLPISHPYKRLASVTSPADLVSYPIDISGLTSEILIITDLQQTTLRVLTGRTAPNHLFPKEKSI